MTEGRLQWHPAFVAALHIEFEDELDILKIHTEYQLSKKPMQIDALLIKKAEDVPIRKNIGRIFRRHNIVEYKSPDDYLSMNDFYKVYGYACMYQSDTERVGKISPGEITITYVCNRYPRKMISHLKRKRRVTVTKEAAGIYYLSGDEFPIQLIITKELSKEENYWLQSLRKDLKAGPEIQALAESYEPKRKNPYYQALMDLIVRANRKEMEEARKMCNAIIELFEEESKEIARQAREEGRKQGLEQGVEISKLFAAGTSVDLIAKVYDVSAEKVQQILE